MRLPEPAAAAGAAEVRMPRLAASGRRSQDEAGKGPRGLRMELTASTVSLFSNNALNSEIAHSVFALDEFKVQSLRFRAPARLPRSTLAKLEVGATEISV